MNFSGYYKKKAVEKKQHTSQNEYRVKCYCITSNNIVTNIFLPSYVWHFYFF